MVIAFVLWVLVGIGVGALVRNQVVAIVVVLVFTQFLEPIGRLPRQLRRRTHRVDPLSFPARRATRSSARASSHGRIGRRGPSEPLEWWVGGLVLLGYAVVFLVLGHFTSWRRDVT